MTVLGVAVFGALGALARYGVSMWALRLWGASFPMGTLIVNVIGCFCLGLLAETALGDPGLTARTRTILGTGFLGAFTTFSTFGVETLRAIEAGSWGVAAGNVALNVVGGIVAVALGFALARQFGG